MPELPEVEVTRLGLKDRLRGARVNAARLGKPLRWPLGVPVTALCGLQVGEISRRGKYLWMPMSGLTADEGSSAEGGLLVHLGMSGSLVLADAPGDAGPHVHFELSTTRGVLRLTDPRRFGAVVWSDDLKSDPAAKLLSKLGAEPFDANLTPARFHQALQGRSTNIKSALLAGDIVVGAGNIYVSEALFRAGIDPRARCDKISRPRSQRLLEDLRLTLAQAIELGGSTLRDFRDAHGMSGAFQSQALVYGREGLDCPRCGVPVRRLVQGQRATYFCGKCQRR